MLAEPEGEQSGQRVAVGVALTFVAEVGTERLRKGGNGFGGPGDFGEIAEMPAGERHEHEADAVAAGEVLPVGAVQGIAEPFSAGAVDHHLGQEPEIARRGECDVLQGNADPCALTGGIPMAQCGTDCQRHVQPAADIPGRKHMVDRRGQLARAR